MTGRFCTLRVFMWITTSYNKSFSSESKFGSKILGVSLDPCRRITIIYGTVWNAPQN